MGLEVTEQATTGKHMHIQTSSCRAATQLVGVMTFSLFPESVSYLKTSVRFFVVFPLDYILFAVFVSALTLCKNIY